jgi:hypothetical protein
MSSARVLGWVKGRAKQKRSLTFCVFLDTKAFARIEKKECNFLGNFLLLLLAPMRACHNLRGLVTIYLYAAMSNTCLHRQMHINEFPSHSQSQIFWSNRVIYKVRRLGDERDYQVLFSRFSTDLGRKEVKEIGFFINTVTSVFLYKETNKQTKKQTLFCFVLFCFVSWFLFFYFFPLGVLKI